MKTQGMSAATCGNYIRGMKTLVRKYAVQVEEACIGAYTCKEAFYRFARIIQETTDFPTWNRDGHNVYLASMSKYQAFLSAAQNDVNTTQIEQPLAHEDPLVEIFRIIKEQYPNGVTFGEATMRLISSKVGFSVDKHEQDRIKQQLFRRNDEVYFVIDSIAPKEVLCEMDATARQWLNEYKCFDIGQLYELYRYSLNESAITNLLDFESLFFFWNKNNIRCISHYGERICRVNPARIWEIFKGVAMKLVAVIQEEFGGTASLEYLQQRFPAFSGRLIELIAKNDTNELVRVVINDTICYQTLDTLGLAGGFTNTLHRVLAQLENLDLSPSEDNLHTALSLAMGVNFRQEYSIADSRTYRNLLAYYYKDNPPRRWREKMFSVCSHADAENDDTEMLTEEDDV